MDGFLSNKTIQNVKEILESPTRREKMVNLNYEVASRHYSYSVLRNQISTIMNDFFSEYEQPHSNKLSGRHNIVYLKTDPPPVKSDSLYGEHKRYTAKQS
jgi:hypothetical protein